LLTGRKYFSPHAGIDRKNERVVYMKYGKTEEKEAEKKKESPKDRQTPKG
jgi:hypothetical protein